MIRKIALFVPFQAFVLALLPIPFEYPVWLDDLLKRMGATLVPIAPRGSQVDVTASVDSRERSGGG